jgi:hypothetical protein
MEDEDELVFDGIEEVRPVQRALAPQRAVDVHAV